MQAIKYRVVSLGELPKSKGGSYNPAAIKRGSKRLLLPRVEKDYEFTNDVQAVLVEGEIEDLKKGKWEKATTLKRVGFTKDVRIEDFRFFEFKGELYCTCTWVYGWNGSSTSPPKAITPIICKIENDEIRLFDYLDVPLKRKSVEKNWLCFEWNNELYCIYSLDPLIIFKHQGFSWRLVKEEENGLQNMIAEKINGSGYLSLSAITHWRDEYMLGFWHTYQSGIIKQGAFILDMKTLDIVHFTEPIIDGNGWDDGYKKGICYVSGLVVNDDTVEVWCGESDSHTSMLELNKKELTDIIVQYPYKKKTPMKVLFKDKGIGDYICGMYSIQGYLNENPDKEVVLYLPWGHLHELSSVMRMPRVRVVHYNLQNVTIDLTSNDGGMYQDKVLFGDFKKWYSLKMGSEPSVPDMSHIKDLALYKGCVVLSPYAAWSDRTWDIKNWKLLAEMLMQRGFNVVVSDQYENRCKDIPGEKFCEKSLMDNFKLIKSAALVISNESGMAHVAGLLNTPCIVLSGWLNPEAVYAMTNNTWIWNQTSKNIKNNLQLITVEHVIEKIDELGIKPEVYGLSERHDL